MSNPQLDIAANNAEFYRQLVESVADYAILRLDPNGKVASWNVGAQHIKGYTADEIIGQHFSVFYSSEDVANGKPEHELRVASSTGRFEDEGYRVRKNGSQFWANVVITALHDADGKLVGYSKVTRDLTDRKSAEDKMRLSAVELETVAKIAAATVTNLHIDEVLQIACDLTKENFALYHAHIYLLDDAGANLVLAAGAGEAGRIMREQGRSIALNNEGSLVARAARTHEAIIVNDVRQVADFLPNKLLPDTCAEMAVPMLVGNRLVGVLDLQSNRVDNFTAEKARIKTILGNQIAIAVENAKAFSRVQKAQAETRRMFDVSVDMVGVADFNGYFLEVNPAWERILGYTPEEITSQPYMNFVHPEDKEKTNAVVAEQLAAGRSTLSFENRYRDRDGKYHWFSWNAVPVLEEGKIYTVTRDVTDAKQSAEEIQRRAVELSTVAEVSTAASTVLDVTELLQTASDLTKSNFNLYHAHIYLLDDRGENLVLAAGAGEAGRIMKEQGRSIALKNEGSLVARAGRSRQGVIVNDVTEAPDFLPNPLLPDTRAEMAIPMIVAGQLIGVLDVQAEQVGRFTDADIRVQSTLAAQIAVAVQNARAFRATEHARELAETVAATNEMMSKANVELDILKPIFDLIPKEHLVRASLAHIETDSHNQPLALNIVAGFLPDGSPLDTRAFGAAGTRLSLNQFRLLQIVIDHPNEPTVIHDAENDPRVDASMLQWARNSKIKSAILLPLKSGDEWHGVITLSYDMPQVFAPELRQIMHSVMPTASSVMKARQAYLQEESAHRHAEIIAETNAALSRSETDIDILGPLYKLAPKDGITFTTLSYTINDAANKPIALETVAGVMPDGSALDLSLFPSTYFPVEDFPIVGLVAQNPDVPLVMNDVTTDARANENVRAFMQQLGVSAMLILPLKTGTTWQGIATVSYATPQTFSTELYDILLKVLPTAGTILAARRAYLQEEAGRREAELIAETNAALSRSETDIDILAPLYKVAPKDGLLYATLSYTINDEASNPKALNTVAGVMPDGSPLDMSIFPTTYFPAEDFPLVGLIAQHPDVPLVMENAMTDPRTNETVRAFIQQMNVGAMILLPLRTGSVWHGIASLSYATPQKFPTGLYDILLKILPTASTILAARRAYLQEKEALRETERRALELQTVAKVSAAAATTLNRQELLQNVTELVKSNFGLYHAHIYLLNETGDTLTLAAGAGEPGRIMKEQGRRIMLTNAVSLVARAGRSRQGVIVNDVTQAADFLPNTLLPNTRAEMAVPMLVGEKLIGVLDVQSDVVGRFTQSDAQVLTTLGDQIAVAVQNAKLFEQQLATAEELRTVDRLKSEFLASMSHELRTPLNSVIGYSRMLLDSTDEDFSEDTLEDLSAIHNGGKHLLSLINDILDLAKIEANKMELDQEALKIETVLHEVSQMTSVLFKGKPVTLTVDIPENLPKLWADHVRLRQVLNNLVSNAVKFTEKGKVTIGAAYTHGAEELTISVQDTGIGIPAEKLNLIFERFTQVDSSSARRAGGTGLGLTITKHLIELHGGRIWAESVDGEGSTFFFTIPLVTEAVLSAK